MTSAFEELITDASTISSLVMSLCSATLLKKFFNLDAGISSSVKERYEDNADKHLTIQIKFSEEDVLQSA